MTNPEGTIAVRANMLDRASITNPGLTFRSACVMVPLAVSAGAMLTVGRNGTSGTLRAMG